ncbi:hypothetical protein DYB38_004445 [Aphanomyces astaci]|uniref:Uncharacterized protein n=1 Tax=Aphanomyces astaci TaxID=112090 RepID=A0A397CXX3_APHAT|nr:hypothetical protein DYB38_004445 [Aphanomyces astaci]
MPLDEGYLHESAMVEHAFSDVMTWQPRIRTIFHKHHNLTTAIQSHLTHHPWTTPIHPLTSRVNPTFSIHDHLVIKWFSPLNRLWGECHEAHVLTVDFPKCGREVPTTTITTQTTTATTSSTLLGRLLEAAFDMEQLVYSLLSAAKTKPLTPKMVASGYLHPRPTDDKWTWPYVVTTFDPELASLGQAVKMHGGLTRASWSALVQWMGYDWFPMFHGLQVPSRPGVLGTDISSLQWYIEYLQRLRDGCFTVTSNTPVVLLHQDLTDENILGYVAASSPSSMSPLMSALACLPPLDRAALEGYCQAHGITTVADLVAVEPWADCTGASDASRWVANALATSFVLQPDVSKEDDNDDDDNDRIEYDGGVTWTPRMVIDFADTKTGDPLWDVIPVLFSMLHGDVALCRELLHTPYWAAYVAASQATTTRLCRRLMQLTLLHPSQSVAALFHHFPHAKTLATWDDIAQFVFGPMVADLEEAQRARKCTRGDALSTGMAALSVVTVP